MSEKEKESLFEQERQDFLWYALFGILKSDVDESLPRSDRNRDKSANREAALQKCIELAYRDFNRTLRFEKDTKDFETRKENWKKDCRELLQKKIIEELIEQWPIEWPPEERSKFFDNWHKELCEKLVDQSWGVKTKINAPLFEEKNEETGEENDKETEKEKKEEKKEEKKGLTFGQAQKWVNMTLKYMLIMNILDWNMDDLAPHLHVPIDNYILRYVREEEAKRENKRPCELPFPLSTDQSSEVRIYADNKIKIGSAEYSWSKISDYDDYKAIQEQLKGLADKENKWPIVWENYAWLKSAKRQQKQNEDNSES